MGKYLKEFDTHNQYESYTADTSNFILPNVSYCKDVENEVHYNPYVEPETRLVAKFNVTSTTYTTRIAYETNGFTDVEIDGVKQPSVTTGYTFSTTGEHTVKYTLKNKTNVGNSALYNCENLVSVDIPNGVTSIGSYAFESCRSLSSITVPDSVISIGDSAFNDCSGLTSFVGNGVTSIGVMGFCDCGNLTSLTISDGATSFGRAVFMRCRALKRLNSNVDGVFNLPSSMTTIVDSMFSVCTSVTTINIPDSVTTIEEGVFSNCSGLTSIGPVGSGASLEIPSGVTSIGTQLFYRCSGLTSVEIPDTVTYIGRSAFGECVNITGNLVIPSGVTSIGGSAFAYCSGLTKITVEATTPPTLGSYAFEYVDCPVYVPTCSLVSVYQSARWNNVCASDCPVLTAKLNVTSTSNSTKILNGTNSFAKIEIDNVEQPSVTTGYTFSTTGEHTVKYHLKATTIDYQAFYGCSNITSIDIPDSVTSIGTGVFRGCSSLTSINIPDSVTSIGNSAFTYCTSLTSITSNAMAAPTIQSQTFQGVNTGGTLTVPIGSSGYDTWMQNANYYLGLYNWTKVEQ